MEYIHLKHFNIKPINVNLGIVSSTSRQCVFLEFNSVDSF